MFRSQCSVATAAPPDWSWARCQRIRAAPRGPTRPLRACWVDGRALCHLRAGAWHEGAARGRDKRAAIVRMGACRMHGQGTFTDTDGHKWMGKFYNGTGPGLTNLL